MLGKLVVNFKRLFAELFGKGKNGGFERRKRRMKMKNGADVALAHGLFVIGVAEESKGYAVCAEGRLNNIRNISFVGFGIKVIHGLAAEFGMLGKVVVGSVGNAPKLAPAEREQIFKIRGADGIEAKLLFGMVAAADILFVHTKTKKPVFAIVLPICEPIKVCAGFAEEFKLHLLKLAGTEGEVAGSDFVTEGFTDLTDAERNLFSCGALNVFKVYENALSRFRTEINLAFCVFGNALEGFKHKVERTDVGKVMGAAHRAGNAFFINKGAHTVKIPAFGVNAGLVGNKLVGSVAGLTVLAVHKRVGKSAHVAGGHPHLGIHKNCGVKTDVIRAFLNKGLPPCAFYVVFELNAQGTVIPCVGKTAVYFRTCINKSAVFAKGNNFIHCFFAG